MSSEGDSAASMSVDNVVDNVPHRRSPMDDAGTGTADENTDGNGVVG